MSIAAPYRGSGWAVESRAVALFGAVELNKKRKADLRFGIITLGSGNLELRLGRQCQWHHASVILIHGTLHGYCTE